MRATRCLIGSACELRAEREHQLGELAATLAPQLPIGDASLLSLRGVQPPSSSAGTPWRQALLVGIIAAVIVLGSGPAIGVMRALLGGVASEEGSPTPGDSASAAASATPTPSPTPSESLSASPSLSPSPTPSATAGGGSEKTYVVQSGDTLYQIALDLNIDGGYKTLARLNDIAGPNYTIVPGQVLKLP